MPAPSNHKILTQSLNNWVDENASSAMSGHDKQLSEHVGIAMKLLRFLESTTPSIPSSTINMRNKPSITLKPS
jgi:hypothetical protein